MRMKDLCQSCSEKVVPNSDSQARTNGSKEAAKEFCKKAYVEESMWDGCKARRRSSSKGVSHG